MMGRLVCRRGLTYVEILICIALIGITFAPLLGLLTTGRKAQQDAVLHARAAFAAESYLEQVRAMPFTDIESVAETAVDSELVGQSGWTWELIVDRRSAYVKDAQVIVRSNQWVEPAITVRFATSIGRDR